MFLGDFKIKRTFYRQELNLFSKTYQIQKELSSTEFILKRELTVTFYAPMTIKLHLSQW
jgi:hypothetical protein